MNICRDKGTLRGMRCYLSQSAICHKVLSVIGCYLSYTWFYLKAKGAICRTCGAQTEWRVCYLSYMRYLSHMRCYLKAKGAICHTCGVQTEWRGCYLSYVRYLSHMRCYLKAKGAICHTCGAICHTCGARIGRRGWPCLLTTARRLVDFCACVCVFVCE